MEGVGVVDERVDVVGPFEGGGVGDVALAGAAAQLRDRGVGELPSPGDELVLHSSDVVGTVAEQRRGHHGDLGSGEQGLRRVEAGPDAGRRGELDVDASVQERNPAQGQAQLLGRGQLE